MVLDIIALALWILIGAMVITRKEVTKLDYGIAYTVLMLQLIENLVEVM